MANSITLTLNRPGGPERLAVEFNGHIETVEVRGEPMPTHSYLHELDGEQRAMRLAQLRERVR